MCTVSRAKRIIACLWLLTSLYCMLWFFLVDINVGQTRQVECGYKVSRNLYLPIYLLDFTLFFAIPLCLATVLYGLIGRVLFLSSVLLQPTIPSECWRDQNGRETNGTDVDRSRAGCPRSRAALSSRKQVPRSSFPSPEVPSHFLPRLARHNGLRAGDTEKPTPCVPVL